MKGYRVYTEIDGQEYKVGAIIQDAVVVKEFDAINGLTRKWVTTWNWVCQGAGKQRRGRGQFKDIQDAKKAFLKVCGFNENKLRFIEILENVAA